MSGPDEEATKRITAALSGDDLAAGVAAFADVVLTVSANGVIEAVVESGSPTLGYRTDELAGMTVTDLFAGDAIGDNDIDCLTAKEFETRLLSGGQAELVVPVQMADGSAVVASFITAPRQSSPGVICFIRHRHQQEPYPSQLIDGVADPLYVLDTDGHFEAVNEAMLAYTGYRREELLGRNIAELLPVSHETRTVLQDGESQDSAGAGSQQVETTIVTKEGTRILTEAHSNILTDQTGAEIGVVGVLRDIQERSRREQNLDLLKQVFSRVFRHNIRNELSIINARAEILADSESEHVREQARKILSSAERLDNHSQKARTISTVIETAQLTETELGTVLRQVVERAQKEHPDAQISLNSPPEAIVTAHPNIGMAFQELIENSAQHAPAQASINIWFDDTENNRTVYVEDNSGGLSEHEIAMLREHNERDLNHTSGVGLWLVRWLVEYSNAELIVHRTGTGTLIGIRFGRYRETEDHTGQPDQPLARPPAHIQDATVEQIQDETVIERVEARQQLEEVYAAVERAGGHTVLVTGEAGVGKTTLIRQFRAQLSERSQPAVSTGVCNKGEQPPYQPFRQVFDDLTTPEETSRLFEQHTDDAAEHLDEVTQRKQALFADVAEQLRTVATTQPVVLVIEDLQWAGQGTLDLFKYLLDHVGNWAYPVMFLGTYRTGDIDEGHPSREIAQWTAEAGRGTVIELEPLDRAAVKSLITDIIDIRNISPAFVDAVHDHTGGTPLFVNEILRNISETVNPETHAELPETLQDTPLPETVEQAVTERLERLPESTRPILETGALLGSEFRFDLLRETVAVRTGELVSAIETLVDHNIWMQSAGTIKFTHGIVRSRAVDAIDTDALPAMHRHAAAAIETVEQSNLDPHAGQLAHHYEEAGEYDTAVSYYQTAGNYAERTYAYGEAARYYEQALELFDAGADIAETQQKQIHADLADIRHSQGKYGAVESLASVADDTNPSRLDCHLVFRRATAEIARGSYLKARETAAYLHEIAKYNDSTRYLADSVYLRGRVNFHRGEYDTARDLYAEAVEEVDGCDDQSRQPNITNDLGLALWRLGDVEQASTHFEECLSMAREKDDRMLSAAALNNLGMIAIHNNDFDRARSMLTESLNITREIGDKRGTASRLGNLGEVAFDLGRYEKSRQYYHDSLEIATEINNQFLTLLNRINLGDTHRRQEQYDQAERYYEESQSLADDLEIRSHKGDALRGQGSLARNRGQYTKASKQFEEALRIAEETGDELLSIKSRLCLARLRLDQNKPDNARRDVATAMRRAEEIDQQQMVALCHEIDGRIERAESNLERAAEQWTEAVALFETAGIIDSALRTTKRLIDLYETQGKSNAVVSWCDRAQHLLEDAHEEVATRHSAWVTECTHE